MKSLLPFLCLILTCINSFSQTNIGYKWQKCYGGSNYEYGNDIQQTTDGGFIIAGKTDSNDGDVTGNHGYSDYWVVKTDQSGIIEWKKTYGGLSDDVANSIQQTTDGGFIVSGYSYSNDGDVTGNHGGRDFWVVKTDQSGTIQWQKTYGGSGYDVSNSIQQTIDGSYILSGYSYSNDGNVSGNHGLLDYWILKTCLADPLSISISGSTNCLPTTLTASNGFLSYVWNTGETSRSINPISGGIYNVEATNLSGCKSESQVIISDPQPPFNGEQICMVTMDEQTGKNAIVIEKTLNAGIDSILTYRIDNLTSQYKKVGSISVDNPGIYFDNGAIPSQQNYQYCISIKDSCGQESNLSPVHRTILLQANVGVNNEVNLFWNPYEGFDYPNFEIYRSNDGNPFFLIANVSNNTYTFTDLIPPSGTKRYQVRVSKEIPCDPSKSAFTSASSNIVNPNAIGIIENTASHFSIQPNPATDNLTLKCNADLLGTDYSIADLTGKILISGKIILGELNINVSELTAGMYTFRIGGSGKAAVKIVKK
jgi:hypothetical protein